MSYSLDYSPAAETVIVKIKGRLNFKTAEKYSKEAVKLAREHECTKYLIDHRETKLEGGIQKIHVSGEELQEFGFKNTDRIAIIIKNSDKAIYQQPVNQNSRWCAIKYFYSKEYTDALNWL